MADAQRVDARFERAYRGLLDSECRADRLHLERVGQYQPVEAELLAQQTLHDARAERGGRVVESGDAHVRGHDRPHAGGDRGPERLQTVFDVARDGRELEMGVLLGRAVAGKVLRTGGDVA